MAIVWMTNTEDYWKSDGRVISPDWLPSTQVSSFDLLCAVHRSEVLVRYVSSTLGDLISDTCLRTLCHLAFSFVLERLRRCRGKEFIWLSKSCLEASPGAGLYLYNYIDLCLEATELCNLYEQPSSFRARDDLDTFI